LAEKSVDAKIELQRSAPESFCYSIHGQYVPGAGDTLIYGPGYVFVPGHGILGEDRDLPTSTCPNQYRTVK